MRIIRLKEVMHKTSISRSMIYLMMSEGNFPKNVKLAPRVSGWVEEEVDAWIKQKVKESREVKQK